MIKLKNEYIELKEKDLVLVGGKAGIGKTRFIVNEVNNSQIDNKVLFCSFSSNSVSLFIIVKLFVFLIL